jgi:hypothetical protein
MWPFAFKSMYLILFVSQDVDITVLFSDVIVDESYHFLQNFQPAVIRFVEVSLISLYIVGMVTNIHVQVLSTFKLTA